MKKNLLTVVILAMVLVNLVLSCLIVFTLVPQAKNVNALITQIATAIDLDLNTDKEGNASTVPLDQVVTYSLEENLTIPLKAGEDGESHMAVLGITISMDSKGDGYSDYGSTIADREDLIKSTIIKTVSQFSLEEFYEDTDGVKDTILEELKNLFAGTSFLLSVEFNYMVTQ